MTPEDRLRDALAARARHFDPDPGLRAGVAALAVALRRRRRIQRTAVSALAVAVVALLLAVAGDTGEEAGDNVRADQDRTPTSDATVDTTTTVAGVAPLATATTVAAADLPPFLVAADEKRLVVLDSGTGRIVRTLVQLPPDPAEPVEECCDHVGDIALSPDGATVYYHLVGEPGAGQIWRVPVEGGEPEPVATNAADPAVSPDGKRLAYTRGDLVVRELATGEERTLAAEGYYVTGPAWAPDSRRVAYSVDVDARPGGVHLLDTATARSLTDARPVPVSPHQDRPDVFVGAWRGATGELVVIRYCCWPEPGGAPVDLLAVREGRVVSTSTAPSWLFDLDYDTTGTYRLMAVRTGPPGEVPEAGSELRWAGGGRSGTLGAWVRAAW